MMIPTKIMPVITSAALSVCIAGSSLPKINANIGNAIRSIPISFPQPEFSAI
jgi:hypothetical protein